eukprot:CAMPEP_0170453818 /NCGR_PEP_ID=MMETSP0123-20130129/2284_1 /TAXON_ID=182087 /ORGANISM="Favella ehrenbergii, Strain Fehren 1" /LENGTH=146 /DNA_ID=CAMNT_0010716339 /DNA_START=1026 /DNA_END=1466 /DNA_ORIENTATION=+
MKTGKVPTSEKQEKPASAADELNLSNRAASRNKSKLKTRKKKNQKSKKAKMMMVIKIVRTLRVSTMRNRNRWFLTSSALKVSMKTRRVKNPMKMTKLKKIIKKASLVEVARAAKVAMTSLISPGIRDDKVSEKSNEDEDEKAKKEI